MISPSSFRIGFNVAAGTESSLPRPAKNNHRHPVVKAGVTEGHRQLFQSQGAVGVVVVGPVDGDAGHPIPFFIENILKSETFSWLGLEITHSFTS